MTAWSGYAQKLAPQKNPAGVVTWEFSGLENVGTPARAIGEPKVINTPYGKAVWFDGQDDGLLIHSNPLAGQQAFTVEAIFRPDAGGNEQQRWLHIQEEKSDSRVLLEIRLSGDQWFLDTYIKSGENSRALYAEHFKHRVGEWYHVALVYDGTTMRHYVDGTEELSGPLEIKPLVDGQTSIGVRLNRVYWFKGAVRKTRFSSSEPKRVHERDEKQTRSVFRKRSSASGSKCLMVRINHCFSA
jgi:hypothetical protein